MDTVLRTENIVRNYSNGSVCVNALKSTSLSFEEGQFTAIVGKSGSGKSTLLRILGSIDRPDDGSVFIDEQSIFELSDKKLSKVRRSMIGYIYQDYKLLEEFTAYENIILPLCLDKSRIDKEYLESIMEAMNISDLKDRFPSEMSGGEQQRTAIARALITHPKVVLADEPSGNLDSENAREVALLLAKASKLFNQTIVMVTHDRQMAEYADRILTMKDGVISELLD